MADLGRVRVWANALIALHLDPGAPGVWSFGYDNAKTRAGLCNFGTKRITVSRYLASRYEDDEIHQILLHEGKGTHGGAVADELAPWSGLAQRRIDLVRRTHQAGVTATPLGAAHLSHSKFRYRKALSALA